MHEVDVVLLLQSLQDPVGGLEDLEPVPAHVGDLEPLGAGKMDHPSRDHPEARDSRRLLAGIKQELVSEADAEVGTVGRDPLPDDIPQTRLAELAGAVPEGAHTRDEQGVALTGPSGSGDMDAGAPGMLDGALDTAEVAASVIDKTDQRGAAHSTPLVLGIPLTRPSMVTAASIARPRALKTPSAM